MKLARSMAAIESRHGILPVRYPQSKKMLADQYRISGDIQHKFSCRRSWIVFVCIWLKIKLTGDEVLESIEGIEIPPGGHPSEVNISPPTGSDIRWAENPPVKLYELKQAVETGLRFAEESVSRRARELQIRQLSNRLPALERMGSYYRQLAVDSVGSNNGETDVIHAEYQRRLHEEIQYARVKATLDLMALETISTPVQKLMWVLQRGTQTREVASVVNLYTGRILTPVRCDICGDQIDTFGLSELNELFCINCRNGCSQSGRLAGPNRKPALKEMNIDY